jgi:dTDP-4-amino-4,6-dideoxy-D-galactose acyltransferase
MSNEKIKYLIWDSDFFKKKIGQISVGNSDNLVSILQKIKEVNYQLIYVSGNKDFFINDDILKQFNGKLVGKKVLFEKNLESKKEQTSFVTEYTSDELIFDLEQLAYISGKYSRFKLDKNFLKEDFCRMYRTWIENSVKHKIADKVFVTKEKDSIKGMVTLKIDDEKGYIGLIAVSTSMQGKGYGKALISACENELLHRGVFKLEIPTHADNIQACKFYEKCGFELKQISNIYHFWL